MNERVECFVVSARLLTTKHQLLLDKPAGDQVLRPRPMSARPTWSQVLRLANAVHENRLEGHFLIDIPVFVEVACLAAIGFPGLRQLEIPV